MWSPAVLSARKVASPLCISSLDQTASCRLNHIDHGRWVNSQPDQYYEEHGQNQDCRRRTARKRFESQSTLYRVLVHGCHNSQVIEETDGAGNCLLYTSPSPRDRQNSRMPS